MLRNNRTEKDGGRNRSRRSGSKKKYMIRCDMEGVSGVVSNSQTDPSASDYAFGLRMFHSDLGACVDGLLAGGAGEVVVYDEHYYGRNTDPTQFPERVSVICGKPPYREDWAGGLDSSFTGVVLLGLHSMAGTGELLCHSYEPDIRSIRLNGIAVGEIGMETAVAGDYGVPVVLVTADSAGAIEAEQTIPGVATVVVKESLYEFGGRCFPLSKTSKAIKATASDVVRHPPRVHPWRIEPPVTLEVELNDGRYLNAVKRLHGGLVKKRRIVRLKGPSTIAVWAQYWQLKLQCQTLLTKE